jgi:Secretion system C-terminal sorting domain/GEVED domain
MKFFYKFYSMLVLLVFFSINSLQAQISTLYNFSFTPAPSSPSNSTYTDITEGRVDYSFGYTGSGVRLVYVDTTNFLFGQVGTGVIQGPGIPLGFNFIAGIDTFDRVGISEQGWIRLGKSKYGNAAVDMTTDFNNGWTTFPLSGSTLFSTYPDYNNVPIDRSFTIAPFATASYEQLGFSLTMKTQTAPSGLLVTTIQWKNFLVDDATGGLNNFGDSISYQLKLYSNGEISFNYGKFIKSQNYATGSAGEYAEVGIANKTDFLARTTATNWQSTNNAAIKTQKCRYSPTIKPSNGLIFLFSPSAPCVSNVNPGAIFTTDTVVCLNSQIIISDTGYTAANGISFQWYFNGTALPGAIYPTLTDTVVGAGTYYCEVTCLGGSASQTNPITISLSPFYDCYCIKNYGSAIIGVGNVKVISTASSFTNGVFSAITGNITGSIPTYTNFTTLPAIPILYGNNTIIKLTGITQSFNFTPPLGSNPKFYGKVFIDFNHDAVYDPITELVLSDSGSFTIPNGSVIIGIPFIPSTALLGITGMRITTKYSVSNDPCVFQGEAEDYFVDIQSGTPCTGSPFVGSTFVNDTTVCPGTLANFSLNGLSPSALGQTYQWQKNGVNIAGATSIIYSDTITGPDSYRCVVTCTASGLSSIALPITMVINPFFECYCQVTNLLPPSSNYINIGNVTVGSFTNGTASPIYNNPSSISLYTNYTNLGPIPLYSGASNFFQVSGIYRGAFSNTIAGTTIYARVYIDYNHDAYYDPITEVLAATGNYSATNGLVITGGAVIPSSALNGITGMRVMLFANATFNSCNAPTSLTLALFGGETEDYLVDIQPGQVCIGLPIQDTSFANKNTFCIGDVANFSLSSSINASVVLNYQWQKNGTNIAGATNITYTDTISGSDTYQCLITCPNSGLSVTSIPHTVILNPFFECYCSFSPMMIASGIDIGNVSVGSFSNGNASPILGNTTSINTYSNFTSLPPIPLGSGAINYFKIIGITSNISTQKINGKIFIDYNHDAVYDPLTELVLIDTGNFLVPNGSVLLSNSIIPATAQTGITGMRVMLYNTVNSIQNPCIPPIFSSGETEDYLVDIQQGQVCTGIPDAYNTIADDSSICLGAVANFSLSNVTSGLIGITYQWQKNGVNIPGANNIVLSETITGPDTYQCVVTCTASGQSTNYSAVTISINPFYFCYCSYTPTLGTSYLRIGNFKLDNFSNGIAGSIISNNNVSSNNYTNYTSLPTPTIISGSQSKFQITGVTVYPSFANSSTGRVYIDYNHNGAFDSTELVISKTVNTPLSSFIADSAQIPFSALSGITGMRVTLYVTGSIGACNPSSYIGGETEDYLVNILPAPICSGAPTAGSIQSSSASACLGVPLTLSLNTSANSTAGISYQWSANGSAIQNSNSPTLVVTQSTNTLYTCVLTCASSSLSSNATALTVNMNTAANCLCIPTFQSTCFGDVITLVRVNNVSNSTIGSCGVAPYYTKFAAPIFSANNGDTAKCAFYHTTSSNTQFFTSYLNVWIDYNDDYILADSERVITNYFINNLSLINQPKIYFLTNGDTGLHVMRVVLYRSSFNQLISSNPQPCGYYGFGANSTTDGETEDYMIHITDTNNINSVHSFSKINGVNVKLYPNPNSGKFKIESLNHKMDAIIIYDQLGRKVYENKNINDVNASLDLSIVQPGVYNVEILINDKRINKQLVISR